MSLCRVKELLSTDDADLHDERTGGYAACRIAKSPPTRRRRSQSARKHRYPPVKLRMEDSPTLLPVLLVESNLQLEESPTRTSHRERTSGRHSQPSGAFVLPRVRSVLEGEHRHTLSRLTGGADRVMPLPISDNRHHNSLLPRRRRRISSSLFLLSMLHLPIVSSWVVRRTALRMATDSRALRFFGDVDASKTRRVVSATQHTVLTAGVAERQWNAAQQRAMSQGSSGEAHYVGPTLQLTPDEANLFALLRQVRKETGLETTLRVAGGWVRDRLLATPEFQAYHQVWQVGTAGDRLTSKFRQPAPSMGRQGTKVLVSATCENQPVDIDIALDDMVGREFADYLNEYLSSQGEDTVSVGVVLKNPEKSKHLETATMKVGSFWIDFVNLRAEEYTQDSRIPDLMRIGTASEDAFRRDLTINALFYNINTGHVEDWTGRGIDDLRKGVVSTPLPPLTTLLDDPLRVLRSVRFAARLRFSMDNDLVAAAKDERVRDALGQKVSRERVGGEVDLMLRSPDPVGAMRLLINLDLIETVLPVSKYLPKEDLSFFDRGLSLLSTAHDYLADCRVSPPVWCVVSRPCYGAEEMRLTQDQEARRLLWYAAFLKPLWNQIRLQEATEPTKGARGKKTNRSILNQLLVDDLKRPTRDAEAVEKIIKAADEIARLVHSGCDVSATMILLSEVQVAFNPNTGSFDCTMSGRRVDSVHEEDPVWEHAMEFRLLCSKVLQRIGPLWRAALILAVSEGLMSVEKGLEYAIEGDVIDESQEEQRQGVIERFDAFAAALQQTGLIGIWNEEPLLNGGQIKAILPNIPRGPSFRDVMDEQSSWMIQHPCGSADALALHLLEAFPDYGPVLE